MNNDPFSEGVARAQAYMAGRPDRPVYPTAAAIEGLSVFHEPLPNEGTDAQAVIAMLDEVGSTATVQTNGPRYFGFVTGGAMPVARGAAALGSAWDQNGAIESMSPTAAALDLVATSWVKDLISIPASATGVFCGGASEANLIALITARDSVLADAGWDVQARGMFGAPPITVVVSAEAHISVIKALGLAGLGRERVVTINTDSQGALDLRQLAAIGHFDGPTILCLQAGNVNTGHSDPFSASIGWARESNAWVHVDGAFGLWAAASPAQAHLIEGHDAADSWAIDCHKWLNVPYDSALAYVADGSRLRASMAAMAQYIGPDSGRAPMHLGLQMSQRARAVDTWSVIKHLGRSGIADLIARSCSLASMFAERLSSGGVEICHEVVLNQVLARFGDDETTDAVVRHVQGAGVCWVGPTTWKSQRAMRISVSGAETTHQDVEVSVQSILDAWSEVRQI